MNEIEDFLNGFRGQLIVGQALNVAIETMKNRQPEWKREPSNISDMEYILKSGPMMDILSSNSNPAYDTFITVRIRDGKHDESVSSEIYEMYEDNYVNGHIAIEVAKALDFVFGTTSHWANSHLWAEVVYEMIPTNDFPDGEYAKRIIYPIVNEDE